MESLSVLYSKVRVLALPTNIRQGWKWIEVANALAYYDTATITAVKNFIVQAPGPLVQQSKMGIQAGRKFPKASCKNCISKKIMHASIFKFTQAQ